MPNQNTKRRCSLTSLMLYILPFIFALEMQNFICRKFYARKVEPSFKHSQGSSKNANDTSNVFDINVFGVHFDDGDEKILERNSSSTQRRQIFRRLEDILPKKSIAKAGLIVMFRTCDSEKYVEEVVAFYLAQGATLIHIIDSSNHGDVYDILLPYIELNLVQYDKFTWDYKQQHRALSLVAHSHIRYLNRLKSGKAWWLLSVDDDEFVMPHKYFCSARTIDENTALLDHFDSCRTKTLEELHKTMTLVDFLGRDDVRRYKSVRFAWRPVGTSNISNDPEKNYGQNQSFKLDIERFTRMARLCCNSRFLGKTAFQVNHPKTSLFLWLSQASPTTKRPKGPYFMHGNNPKLGNDSLLQHGFVYHLTRSKEDVTRRQEYHGYAKSDFYRDFKLRREINEVIDGALAAWSLRIKTIIDIVRNRPTKDKIHAEMLVDQIQVDQKDSLRSKLRNDYGNLTVDAYLVLRREGKANSL
mmetsp:Transcript_13713/g.20704  ORF Transcript_13713/g.20704 Transcript_13713/m.20704 type:complete len:471 (+) Transcript_13713:54-1466(+)